MYDGRWFALCLFWVAAMMAPFTTRADGLHPRAGEQVAGEGGGGEGASEESVDVLSLSADELSVDLEAKTAQASGHVVLSRGDITVNCDQVDVKYEEFPAVTWARGAGNVSLTLHGMRATAGQVEVHVAQQIVVVSGGVVIRRGKGEIRAQAASISMKTGKVTLTQVKGTLPIPPESQSALGGRALDPSSGSANE